MAKYSYLKAIGRELGRHAVWDPGDDVAPGDYGVFRGGAFVRLGQVADLGVAAPKLSKSQPTPWTFMSRGVRLFRAGAEGEIPAAIPHVDAHVRTGIGFASEGSVFITTGSSSTREIKNLGEVANAIASARPQEWGMRKALVRWVRDVSDACVLVAANADASAVVAGEVSLQVGEVTNAGFNLDLESSTDSMLSYPRVNGALLLDIVYVWLLPGVSMLAAGPGDEPYRIEAVESISLPKDTTDVSDPRASPG